MVLIDYIYLITSGSTNFMEPKYSPKPGSRLNLKGIQKYDLEILNANHLH